MFAGKRSILAHSSLANAMQCTELGATTCTVTEYLVYSSSCEQYALSSLAPPPPSHFASFALSAFHVDITLPSHGTSDVFLMRFVFATGWG